MMFSQVTGRALRALAARPLCYSAVSAADIHYAFALGRACRSFSSTLDPYKTLGVERNASAADIKKAYKEKALKWHPDKNPDDRREEAQERFADAASAYEILKDDEKRREYDLTGQVGGNGPGPHGAPGGFHFGRINQADAERLFREAFGQGGMDQLLQQFLRQQQQGQPGRFPGASNRRVLAAGMEVQIRSEVAAIHKASRASGIDAQNDERRTRCAGKIGTITQVDPRDQSIKVRVPVLPGRADEVWFGVGAVEPLPQPAPQMHPGSSPSCGGMDGGQASPRVLHVGMEVQVLSDVTAIHDASRASGISADNDMRRARCAGKVGTITQVDPSDQSIKVRVPVLPGKADVVWFGASAVEPLLEQGPPHVHPQKSGYDGMSGFSSAA